MSANCEVTVIFPNCGQFGAIRKSGCGRLVCKIYIFINSSLLLKLENQKISNRGQSPSLMANLFLFTKRIKGY